MIIDIRLLMSLQTGGCDSKHKPRPCEWKGGRCVCIEGAVVEPQIACSEQAEVQARLYYPSKYTP